MDSGDYQSPIKNNNLFLNTSVHEENMKIISKCTLESKISSASITSKIKNFRIIQQQRTNKCFTTKTNSSATEISKIRVQSVLIKVRQFKQQAGLHALNTSRGTGPQLKNNSATALTKESFAKHTS